jgi:hypothetical protein
MDFVSMAIRHVDVLLSSWEIEIVYRRPLAISTAVYAVDRLSSTVKYRVFRNAKYAFYETSDLHNMSEGRQTVHSIRQ